MKKFTPIAMKCTQEDWESIKNEIPERYVYDLDEDWEEQRYITNNLADEEMNISNIPDNSNKLRYSRRIYEKFDANIFLNACGIDYYEVVKSDKPSHYQTENNIDIIDFCKMYDLNFNRGNVIKYVARAGKKDDEIKDLEKALDFIQREIKYLKEK